MTDYFGEAQCFVKDCQEGAKYRLLYFSCFTAEYLDTDLVACDPHCEAWYVDCFSTMLKCLPVRGERSKWLPF